MHCYVNKIEHISDPRLLPKN